MRPKLLEIPLGIATLPVHAYGFMLMLGFLVGVIICARRGRRLGISPDFVIDMTIGIMIASIIGARIGYLIQFRHMFDFGIFDLSDGGVNLFGGIVGWILPLGWYLRRKRQQPQGASPSPAAAVPARRELLSLRELAVLVPACFGMAVIVARGVHLMLNRHGYNWELLRVWEGGLAFYGGVIVASVAGYIAARRAGLPFLRVADLVMPEVALGYGITRLGCFLNGCCFGTVAQELPWAVRFPRLFDEESHLIGSPAYLDHFQRGLVTEVAEHSLPVHPTQLYSLAWGLVLFGILSVLWYRRRREGEVFAWFGILYAIERFLLEFLRADNQTTTDAAKWLGWMTMWQWVSVLTLAGMAAGLVWVYRKQPRLSEAERNPGLVADAGAGVR